jgi:hypothetical protein
MHSYAGDHGGKLPTAIVHGKDGRPLLSWRVLLLPYLGQESLYSRFRLDEPWDSPNNLPLLDQMPELYALPPRKARNVTPNHTVCHVFIGKGAAFENADVIALDDFPDGTSNTMLVFEGGEPAPWTKPDEIAFDPDAPLALPRAYFTDLYRIGFADGSVKHLSARTVKMSLRAMVTRNGGDRWDDQSDPNQPLR